MQRLTIRLFCLGLICGDFFYQRLLHDFKYSVAEPYRARTAETSPSCISPCRGGERSLAATDANVAAIGYKRALRICASCETFNDSNAKASTSIKNIDTRQFPVLSTTKFVIEEGDPTS